ncbi:MAG: beta strand repeat-containing protein [Bacteroidia bacterium]
MKIKSFILVALFFYGLHAIAQTPQKINYQGVVRNGSGLPLPNKPIGIKFQIHESGPSGNVIFSEQQSVTTNSLGLFSTQIGKVNNLGIITWTNSPYFMDILADTMGGSAYVFVGNQEIVSVPFALYAEKAGNAANYSGSPNITISGPPNNVINLSPTLSNSLTVGAAGIIKSTIPKLDIDMNGRIIAAGEYTANILGDISGPLHNQTVTGIQGNPVAAVTPTLGQVLVYQTNGWTPFTPTISGGPWNYATGNIFPSNSASSDKVNIGQTTGGSLLNVNNSSVSGIISNPVTSISNLNPNYSSQGVLSVTNFSGNGACVYIQNNLAGNNSAGMVINLSNTSSSSPGISVTHVGTGNAGFFSTTNSSSISNALLVQSNSGSASAFQAQNLGTGAAITGSNNATAATAQFINSGTGSAVYSTANGSSPGIISYNSGSGIAVHGFNTSSVSSGSAHGVLGQTGNPSTAANGVIGINTNAGTAIYGLNNFTANASSFAHGVRGETSNTAAQASGVMGQNFGGGAGVTGISSFTPSSGNAFGVYGETNNSAVNSSGIFGKSIGTGNGVTGTTGSFATNAAGIYGDNAGAGYAVYGIKQGTSTGNAAKFENLNGSNGADAVYAITQGPGAAIHAQAGSGGGSALSLLLDAGHIKAVGSPLSVTSTSVSGGFAAISGQSCINCNDIRGTVLFNASATGFTTINFADVTVTFAKPFANAPIVNITPLTDMQNISYMVSNTTTTTFTIRIYRSSNTGGGSLTSTLPSATFKFNYFVIE